MPGAQRYLVVVTQGTSPGIAAELLNNMLRGRVVDLPPGEPEKLVIVATQHPLVVLAAKVARMIIECCVTPVTPVEIHIASVEDVVDAASFDEYYSLISRILEEAKKKGEYSVVLDITGGRASMAVAAYKAAREKLGAMIYVTTTQIPQELYRDLNNLFLSSRGDFEKAAEAYGEARASRGVEAACEEARRILGEKLCKLLTGRAVSSVITGP